MLRGPNLRTRSEKKFPITCHAPSECVSHGEKQRCHVASSKGVTWRASRARHSVALIDSTRHIDIARYHVVQLLLKHLVLLTIS